MISLSRMLLPRRTVMLSNFTKENAHTGPEPYFSHSVLLTFGTKCPIELIFNRYHCSCAVSAVWIYLAICIILVCIVYERESACLYVYGLYMSLVLLHFAGLLLVQSMPCCPVI